MRLVGIAVTVASAVMLAACGQDSGRTDLGGNFDFSLYSTSIGLTASVCAVSLNKNITYSASMGDVTAQSDCIAKTFPAAGTYSATFTAKLGNQTDSKTISFEVVDNGVNFVERKVIGGGKVPESDKPAAEKKETPKVEEQPKIEETPKIEDKPNFDETPKVEEQPKTEETPKVEEQPKTEETPKVEEQPKAEETPKTEEQPKTEETPKVEEQLKTEETPKVEEQPKTEEAPKTEEQPKTEETPNSGDEPKTEENPEGGDNPGNEEEPSQEDTSQEDISLDSLSW